MKQVVKTKHLPIWQLIKQVKLLSIQVFPQIPTTKNKTKPKLMRNNWFQRSLMPQRITRMICSCKYPWLPETMPCTWVQSLWDHPNLSQQESCSTQALNILPSHPHSAMTRLPVTLNSRSMIHSQAPSSRETNWMKGAKLKHMTWKNLTPIRFSQRHLPSWPTAQPSSRVSYGKITAAFSHSRAQQQN